MMDKLVNISVIQFMLYSYSYRIFDHAEYYHYLEPSDHIWMIYKKRFNSGVIRFHDLLNIGIKL